MNNHSSLPTRINSSGFFNLSTFPGSLHRRPSELVDKILKTLRDRERDFQRTSSTFSTGSHSIPSRFKIMDPNRTTFDSLVKQVAVKAAEKEKPNSFRSLARSVLSPENRCWRQGTTFIMSKNNIFSYQNNNFLSKRLISSNL